MNSESMKESILALILSFTGYLTIRDLGMPPAAAEEVLIIAMIFSLLLLFTEEMARVIVHFRGVSE